MSEKLSKAVQDRAQTVSSFLSLVRANNNVVEQSLADVLSLDELGLNGTHVMEIHLHAMEQSLDELCKSDEALILEAEDDKQYRDARDQGLKQVRATLIDVRNLVEAAYGEKVSTLYKLAGDYPRSPELIRERGEEIVTLLRDEPFDVVSPYGFELNLSLLADRVETELIPLEMAMDDIRREVREIQEALEVRNLAMSRFDQVFEAISHVVRAYFVLSGRPDLAMTIG